MLYISKLVVHFAVCSPSLAGVPAVCTLPWAVYNSANHLPVGQFYESAFDGGDPGFAFRRGQKRDVVAVGNGSVIAGGHILAYACPFGGDRR